MQAEVTFGTWECWSPQSRMSMFKQLYLSGKISELPSESTNSYISPLPIHGYIQNKFLTCTREVGDPILSQNIDLKYVVPKAKQEIKLRTNTWRYLKKLGINFLGFMCKQNSHMANEYADDRNSATMHPILLEMHRRAYFYGDSRILMTNMCSRPRAVRCAGSWVGGPWYRLR